MRASSSTKVFRSDGETQLVDRVAYLSQVQVQVARWVQLLADSFEFGHQACEQYE
jgi:hypothetical protein